MQRDDDDTCFFCHGLRGHMRLKHIMSDNFTDEYDRASVEVVRLVALLKDVYWYHFETQCKTWRVPWNASNLDSIVMLHGNVIDTYTRNGIDQEVSRFPLYFAGRVDIAPELPPAIVLNEVKKAVKYQAECKTHINAPHDWAPGGCKYKQLLRDTLVPTELSRKRNEAQARLHEISRHLDEDGRR